MKILSIFKAVDSRSMKCRRSSTFVRTVVASSLLCTTGSAFAVATVLVIPIPAPLANPENVVRDTNDVMGFKRAIYNNIHIGSAVDLGVPDPNPVFTDETNNLRLVTGRNAPSTINAVFNFNNCTLVANADQRDTDGDNYGNICDADFDGNGSVNVFDLGRFS